MIDLQQKYCELLGSPELLAVCRQASCVAEFLARLKSIWQLSAVSDDFLLAALHQLNRQVMDMDVSRLARQWLPYRYHAMTRSISWCLPNGRATEPFQDQTITRYREQLINQFLIPKTSLSSLFNSPLDVSGVSPAGFIFHLSRCGSTLLSGSITELASASVLSESPALTECLLDTSLTPVEQRRLLFLFMQLQAQAVAPFVQGDMQHLVVKWNAWDILQWSLIRSLYPQVPVIFLIRNPIEILASHQKSAGRHMAGDPSMVVFDGFFGLVNGEDMLAMRTRVLQNLLAEMKRWCQQPGIKIVDYRQLTGKNMVDVMGAFSLLPTDSEREAIIKRMGFNAKELGQSFSSDSHQKQLAFDDADREKIHAATMPLYESLLELTAQK